MTRRMLFAAPIALCVAFPLFASTYTVNSNGDASDLNPGDNICATAGAVCTLRAALEEANAHGGPDTIIFSTTGVISITTAYPGMTDTVTIDGTSAPGYLTAPVVKVDGGSTADVGFSFMTGSSGSSLSGLEVSGFVTAGVQVLATNVTIQRNYLGPVTQGTPNAIGLLITADNTVVGGTGLGNVVSGNSSDGIQIVSSVGHTVAGNLVGTNPAGTAALANVGIGINVLFAASFTLGSNAATGQNVISGNTGGEVVLNNCAAVTVAGNYIGPDVTGTAYISNNASEGVVVFASDSCIIGTTAGRNIISGNAPSNGVRITGGATATTLVNNYIGVDVTGAAILANGTGITVDATTVTIGTTAAGNVITGNDLNGIVFVTGADNAIIQHNIIGLASNGDTILGNGSQGVNLCCTANTLVGGTAAGQGNVVSGNGGDGISAGTGSSNNTIQGNIVGLNAAGNDIRGNGQTGVDVAGLGHTIGGNTAAARNVVSGNSIDGILLAENASGITVTGNYVGTDVTGTVDLGNSSNGVEINGTSAANTVTANVIAGNDLDGVRIFGANGQSITNNLIGRNASDTADLPNSGNGVNFATTSAGSTVQGNSIRGNTLAGIAAAATTDNNTFSSNFIQGNGGLGIDLESDGVTANDPQDADAGANTRQNFPVVTYAVSNATQTQVGGTINSNPSTSLTIWAYQNTTADPSGNGEGETPIGSTNVTTDAGGNATFILNANTPTGLGRVISTTATGPHGTSEFSKADTAVTATAGMVQFSSATYTVNENGGFAPITVTRTGDTATTVTVDYTTSNGTATAGQDYTTTSGTLTFGPGVTSQSFNVPITNDTTDEPNETVNLTLSNPIPATIGTSTATLTIIDDDPASTPADVPALSEWMLVLLAAMLGLLAAVRLGR